MRASNPSRTRRTAACLAAFLFPAFLPGVQAADAPAHVRALTQTEHKNRAPIDRSPITFRIPDVQTLRMMNGVTVYVVEDHRIPMAKVSIYEYAGRMDDDVPGTAYLCSESVLRGTADKTAAQFQDALADIGGDLTADYAMDHIKISGEVESGDWKTLLSLASDALQHPRFDEKEVGAQRRLLSRNAMRHEFSSAEETQFIISHLFYEHQPFGDTAPMPEDYNKIDMATLRAFYKEHYGPANTIVCVTGDIAPAEAMATAKRLFSGWQNHTERPDWSQTEITPPVLHGIFLVDWPAFPESIIHVVVPAPPRRDPDFLPMMVVKSLLGQEAGRFNEALRERRGLAYSVGAEMDAYPWPGVFEAYANVPPLATGEAVGAMQAQIADLRNTPVSDEELDRAKRRLLGAYALGVENAEYVAWLKLEWTTADLPSGYASTFCDDLNAVTTGDVLRVARKYLADDRIEWIVLGDSARVKAQLKPYGDVYGL